MISILQIFDGPVLSYEEYISNIEDFSQRSGFYYKPIDNNKNDIYVDLPLCVESYFTHNINFIYGLVGGDRPGKCLLRGVVKITSFTDTLYEAFEAIQGVPARLEQHEREKIIKSLRRRLNRSILYLADHAGMQRYTPLVQHGGQ